MTAFDTYLDIQQSASPPRVISLFRLIFFIMPSTIQSFLLCHSVFISNTFSPSYSRFDPQFEFQGIVGNGNRSDIGLDGLNPVSGTCDGKNALSIPTCDGKNALFIRTCDGKNALFIPTCDGKNALFMHEATKKLKTIQRQNKMCN